jgi:hypothetical protein
LHDLSSILPEAGGRANAISLHGPWSLTMVYPIYEGSRHLRIQSQVPRHPASASASWKRSARPASRFASLALASPWLKLFPPPRRGLLEPGSYLWPAPCRFWEISSVPRAAGTSGTPPGEATSRYPYLAVECNRTESLNDPWREGSCGSAERIVAHFHQRPGIGLCCTASDASKCRQTFPHGWRRQGST